MRNTIQLLQKKGVPAPVIAEVAELVGTVSQLAARLAVIAGGVVGIETLLEYHGLITPEAMEAVKLRLVEKVRTGVPVQQQPEQTPEQEPEQKPE